jgi:RNA polymerase sigma-70 factor, ECF subfamily
MQDEFSGAWEALYHRLEKPLYNMAYRYTWNATEAEDAVHEAFLALWQRRDELRAETADRYLWVAALNAARKRRRWRRLREFVALDTATLVDEHLPEAATANEQQRLRVRAALDRLPEKLRGALVLAEFSDLSYQASAQLLGIPPGTFASRRHLAFKKLREFLAGEPGHE